MLAKMWRKGNIFALVVGMQIGVAIVENSMEIPQKTKNRSAFWLCDPTSGDLLKQTQNTNLKERKHPNVHCSVFYNHQDMEAAQVFISRWVHKRIKACLHNGTLLKP